MFCKTTTILRLRYIFTFYYASTRYEDAHLSRVVVFVVVVASSSSFPNFRVTRKRRVHADHEITRHEEQTRASAIHHVDEPIQSKHEQRNETPRPSERGHSFPPPLPLLFVLRARNSPNFLNDTYWFFLSLCKAKMTSSSSSLFFPPRTSSSSIARRSSRTPRFCVILSRV